MKHNYSLIRRCNCFVGASQFVLVVHRLLLPLSTAHAHPYLTCCVTCAILPSLIILPAIVSVVSVDEVGRAAGEGSFAQNTKGQSEDLWLYHRLLLSCCNSPRPLRIRQRFLMQVDTDLQGCKAIGYTSSLSFYSFPHQPARCRNINPQRLFSSRFFPPVHRVHPNQVQQRTRCCLHVGHHSLAEWLASDLEMGNEPTGGYSLASAPARQFWTSRERERDGDGEKKRAV